MNPKNDLKELVPIAKKFIEVNDFLPREYRDEAKASANLKVDIEQGYYPLLLTSLDTNGEKPFEEFIGEGENILEIGMNQLAAVNYIPAPKDSVKTFTFSTKRYFQLPDFNSKKGHYRCHSNGNSNFLS